MCTALAASAPFARCQSASSRIDCLPSMFFVKLFCLKKEKIKQNGMLEFCSAIENANELALLDLRNCRPTSVVDSANNHQQHQQQQQQIDQGNVVNRAFNLSAMRRIDCSLAPIKILIWKFCYIWFSLFFIALRFSCFFFFFDISFVDSYSSGTILNENFFKSNNSDNDAPLYQTNFFLKKTK